MVSGARAEDEAQSPNAASVTCEGRAAARSTSSVRSRKKREPRSEAASGMTCARPPCDAPGAQSSARTWRQPAGSSSVTPRCVDTNVPPAPSERSRQVPSTIGVSATATTTATPSTVAGTTHARAAGRRATVAATPLSLGARWPQRGQARFSSATTITWHLGQRNWTPLWRDTTGRGAEGGRRDGSGSVNDTTGCSGGVVLGMTGGCSSPGARSSGRITNGWLGVRRLDTGAGVDIGAGATGTTGTEMGREA